MIKEENKYYIKSQIHYSMHGLYQVPVGLTDISLSASFHEELIIKFKENIREELMSMIAHNKILIASEN